MFCRKIKNGNIRQIVVFGKKIFSYTRKKKIARKIIEFGKSNSIAIDDDFNINCKVIGNNNYINIEKCLRPGHINVFIRGNNNKIHIKSSEEIQSLNISIGNFMEISNSEIFIDEQSCIVSVEIVIEQHHSKLHIGQKALISRDVLFRVGEIPHLVFDKDTKKYIDTPYTCYIGNHVWIGRGCTILKKTKIGNNCIIGTQSVCTKDLFRDNCLICGNPAEIKKNNIYWVGSYNCFEQDEQEYKHNYCSYIREFGENSNIN